jgi:hypothetical protein
MQELEGDRKPGYQRSQQRIGIVKEAWYLARTPAGDQLVAYMESPGFRGGWARSWHPVCYWPYRGKLTDGSASPAARSSRTGPRPGRRAAARQTRWKSLGHQCVALGGDARLLLMARRSR